MAVYEKIKYGEARSKGAESINMTPCREIRDTLLSCCKVCLFAPLLRIGRHRVWVIVTQRGREEG